MILRQMVVDAVVLEGRSLRDVARTYGVSKSWVAELVKRHREGGDAALGTDAGAQTIHVHLMERYAEAPSISAIYRALKRRGFVTPEPRKHPKASYVRFEAELPNECWQTDMTHWQLSDATEVEIITFLDDYSRRVLKFLRQQSATDARFVRRFPSMSRSLPFMI
jgi:transposase InsO family protein